MSHSSYRRRRPLRIVLERLELRMLLHGGHDHHQGETDSHGESGGDHAAAAQADAALHAGHDHSALGGRSEIIAHFDLDGDGHLTVDQYSSLSSVQQALFDPHQIIDPRAEAPIHFDELLGIPQGSSATEALAYPDFFPKTTGGFSLDQTSQPGRTLVRFGTQVNNQGTGPGILISGRPGIDPIPTGAPITSWVNDDGSQNVLQAIYNYNGSSFSLSHYLAAGRFTYHQGHGHFHYDGYAYYRLRYNVGGQPGDYVMRPDGSDVIGEKVGFCLINIASSFTTESGQSSTQLPGYNAPGQPNTGCGLLQGVHVGEADIYSSSLTGQWLDVTGIPNGQYFLEIELDGSNAVVETNDANNSKTFPFTLNASPPAGGIQPDVFDQADSNDSFDTATDMGVMGTYAQTGLTIHWGQDFDYFKFVASSTGSYTVTSTQAHGNVDLYLYNSARQQIDASTHDGGGESISYNFVGGETYYVKTEAYNSTTSSNYQVAWNLKPLTESRTLSRIITEDSRRPGTFIIERNGPTTSPLTVNFTLTGTATNGVDYEAVGNSVTLGDLQSTARIEIFPIADAVREFSETVILTITSSGAYVIGDTGTDMVIWESRTTSTPGGSSRGGDENSLAGLLEASRALPDSDLLSLAFDHAQVAPEARVAAVLDLVGGDEALLAPGRAAAVAPRHEAPSQDRPLRADQAPSSRLHDNAVESLLDESGWAYFQLDDSARRKTASNGTIRDVRDIARSLPVGQGSSS